MAEKQSIIQDSNINSRTHMNQGKQMNMQVLTAQTNHIRVNRSGETCNKPNRKVNLHYKVKQR